jgi:hypothetical protein
MHPAPLRADRARHVERRPRRDELVEPGAEVQVPRHHRELPGRRRRGRGAGPVAAAVAPAGDEEHGEREEREAAWHP